MISPQKNKNRGTFSDVFIGDIQAQLSGLHNSLSYFKDYTLEACFTVELMLVNAQHRAGIEGIDAFYQVCFQGNS